MAANRSVVENTSPESYRDLVDFCPPIGLHSRENFDHSENRTGQAGKVPAGETGSKLIRSLVWVAFAKRSNVLVEGSTLPLSSLATTACVVPIASATCS